MNFLSIRRSNMAFKSIEAFNDDRYRYSFRMMRDGETAKVIFLYRSKADMMIGSTHHIMTPSYKGYVDCCEYGCPACARGIRRDSGKIFIPLYNLETNKIEFWDKNQSFEYHMDRMVFDKYPNPSEYVFTITRHGEYRAEKVTYDIEASYLNEFMTYDQILEKYNTILVPQTEADIKRTYYQNICRTYSIPELDKLLNENPATPKESLQAYTATPRAGFVPTMPETFVDSSSLVEDNSPTDDIPVMPTSEPVVADTADTSDATVTDTDDDGEFPDPVF